MFFAYRKLLGRTETRTRHRMCLQTIRTVGDISRDDRATIAICSLLTATYRLKKNYSIDNYLDWIRVTNSSIYVKYFMSKRSTMFE